MKNSSELLDQIMSRTSPAGQNEAISRIEKQLGKKIGFDAEISDLQREINEADRDIATRNEESVRAARTRILESKLEDHLKRVHQDEEDITKAIYSVQEYISNIDEEFRRLGDLNEEELGLVKTAEAELEEAKARRTQADQKWFFKKIAIADSDEEVKRAEQKVNDTRSEAQRRARVRLSKANAEQALQHMQLIGEKSVQLLEKRYQAEQAALQKVEMAKLEALNVKEETAKALKKLETDLKAKEQDLQRAEEALARLENGTPEFSTQHTVVSKLRSVVEETRGRYNAALTLYQSKERFATYFEGLEKSHRMMSFTLLAGITQLRSELQDRNVSFRAFLELKKSLANVDGYEKISSVGAETDQRIFEEAVAGAAIAERLMVKNLKEHPDRMKKALNVLAAQAEARVANQKQIEELVAEYRKNYGIDPTESAFFRYANRGSATSQ